MRAERACESEIKPALCCGRNEQNKFHPYADVPRGLSACVGNLLPVSDAGDKQLHTMKNSTAEKVEPVSRSSPGVDSRHRGRTSIA